MNLFKDLPNNLDEEVFEDLLTHKNLRIERIVQRGKPRPKVAGTIKKNMNGYWFLKERES